MGQPSHLILSWFHVITVTLFVTCACPHSLVSLWQAVYCVLCASMFFLEKDLKTKCVVEMEGNQTILHSAANMNKGDPRWVYASPFYHHWIQTKPNCLDLQLHKYFFILTTSDGNKQNFLHPQVSVIGTFTILNTCRHDKYHFIFYILFLLVMLTRAKNNSLNVLHICDFSFFVFSWTFFVFLRILVILV